MSSTKLNDKITEKFVKQFLSKDAKRLAIKRICDTPPGEAIFEGYNYSPTILEVYEILLNMYEIPYEKTEKGVSVYFIRK